MGCLCRQSRANRHDYCRRPICHLPRTVPLVIKFGGRRSKICPMPGRSHIHSQECCVPSDEISMRVRALQVHRRWSFGSFLIASALLCLNASAKSAPQKLTAHVPAEIVDGLRPRIGALPWLQRMDAAAVLSLGSADPAELPAPVFAPTSATVAAGRSASFGVTLPAELSSASVACLNMPPGATCSYSASQSKLTIAPRAGSPRGNFTVTVVFTDTETTEIATSLLLPAFVLPYLLIRRKLTVRGISIGDFFCFGVVAVVVIAACSGPGESGSASAPLSTTRTFASSGVVTLTVQ
jgi:hypothetical protein